MTPGTGKAAGSSGTTRRVTFPSHSPHRARHVLIVEDDPEVRSLLGFALLREGWIVDTAADGAAAMARLEHSSPDVILLDIAMPNADGWEVLARRAALARWSRIPVVVMSADHHQAQVVIDLGAAAFLPKPFSLDDLRLALSQLLSPPG